MSDKSKLIMETIALVRSRKARPDLDRISKAMQRNHNVDPKDTERWLDMLCEKGIVARRPFKGAVSYRIVADEKAGAAKAHARYFRNAKKIAKAIHDLDPHGLGVSLNAIERFVSTHWRTTCSILSLRVRLRSVLRDGIEEGRFIKTVNGCYKLGTAQPTDPLESAEDEGMEENADDSVDDLLCDYCQQNADRNPFGEPEELLICKDCGNKAHPSCLNYSPELVEQIRADDSWQCIDCKACTICDGTTDPDSLLFCDACDKGYHMTCHTPKLDQMPSGKWMCSLCTVKRFKNGSSEVYIIDEDETMNGTNNNGNIPASVVMTTGGPPTMVQLQRTSQPRPASPAVQPSQARSKNDQMRVRAVNAPFRQPMIALRSPTAPHMRQSIPLQQGTIASFPTIQGQPTSAIYQFPGQINMGKTSLIGAAHVGQGKFQQVHSFLREDILRSLPPDVADWSVADVCFYVKSHGFPGESKLFEEQEVDGKALLLMSRNDVLTGLRLKLGPALKLYHLHISKLQSRTEFIGL
eukprot:Seg2136.1 transcript_id=Seg2136.1/GoldUCD/mRNA.D3Y31 product="Histone acetyltransferase KAT6A" protein_id=Seg2136.1/GoldUCD/D3Y31